MINNIELISPLLYFKEDQNRFMYLQIIQRSRDHKEEGENGVKRVYFIRSKEHLQKLMPEIILLCEHYKARAYINPSIKDFDRLQKLMLSNLANDIYLNSTRTPERCLHSTADKLSSYDPLWVVDIDDMSYKQRVWDWIHSWFMEKFKYGPATMQPKEYFVTNSIKATIPSKSGCHIITRPFDLYQFSQEFPDIDVHKNSAGTLLYYPNSLEDGRD